MQIALRLDPFYLRRWHLDLPSVLAWEKLGVAGVRLEKGQPFPAAVDLLLTLERAIYRLPGPRSSDRVDPGEANTRPSEDRVDLVIDLSSNNDWLAGYNSLRPLYDGVPYEAAVFAGLLDGRVPVIEIESRPCGQILARARPLLENSTTLCEAYEVLAALVTRLLISAIRSPNRLLPAGSYGPSQVRPTHVAVYPLRMLSFAALKRAYCLCFFSPHWRVGWRFVTDRDVWDNQNLGGAPWNILSDPGFRFFADPFPVTWHGKTYVFVEDFDHQHQKGIISACAFGPRGPEGRVFPVLEEAWHLSYPFIMEHAGEIWMIPESSKNRTVSVYRADPFPKRWVKEADLLLDLEASDATILKLEGRLWMFAATREGFGSPSDTLSIFVADDLLGSWRPHEANPVVIDGSCARPAGNMVRRGNRIWRPVQDCRGGYGAALGLAEIIRLTEDGYEQVVRTVLGPGRDWPGRRLHTLNRAGNVECIDGSAHSPRLRLWRS